MKNTLTFLLLGFVTNVCAQNVGVGTESPSAPLHVKSATAFEMLRIEGNSPYISFFDNTQGYRGYLWYNSNRMELGTASGSGLPVVIAPGVSAAAYFTTTGRCGLGISNPTERLDVNGNMNLNGLIKLNGNSGTAGQVLTSNGASDPTWKSTALSNSVRFAFSTGQANSNQTTDSMNFSSTRYNLSPADASVGGSALTINKTGLYHFELYHYAEVSLPGSSSNIPYMSIDLKVGNMVYPLCSAKPLNNFSPLPTTLFQNGDRYSIDIHITAPAVVKIHRNYSNASGNMYGFGHFMGYLISE